MSAFIPTDLVELWRSLPGVVDEYGDSVDTDTPIVTGIPAHITPTRYRTWDPVTAQVTVHNRYKIRLRPPAGYTVTESDRIHSTTTGRVYTVHEVGEKRSPLQAADLTLVCDIIR